MNTRTSFTPDERIAIGELVEFAQNVGDSADDGIRALGAVACERAADIIRGETTPHAWTDEDVVKFAAFWGVEERAAFNPPPVDESDRTDVVVGASRAIARKVRKLIGAELRRKAIGDHLIRLLFFGAVSQLVVEIFTVMPTKNQPTEAERRALFEEFVTVTRQDFEATLANLDKTP